MSKTSINERPQAMWVNGPMENEYGETYVKANFGPYPVAVIPEDAYLTPGVAEALKDAFWSGFRKRPMSHAQFTKCKYSWPHELHLYENKLITYDDAEAYISQKVRDEECKESGLNELEIDGALEKGEVPFNKRPLFLEVQVNPPDNENEVAEVVECDSNVIELSNDTELDPAVQKKKLVREKFSPAEHFTVHEIVEVLGCLENHATKLIRDGEIKAFKHCGRWYVAPGELQAYLNKMKEPAA